VVRAPPLAGLYGKSVPLADGTVTIADERYIRDSIVRPRSEIAAGVRGSSPPTINASPSSISPASRCSSSSAAPPRP
jgi:cytochrome c oxidase subunit 2